jgi:hypothetical protein
MAEEIKKERQFDFNDLQLVGTQATWTMRKEGFLSGTYTGTFTFRCYLTPLQKISAGREQRQLLGESRTWIETPEYERESFLAYALTQLKYRIISSPPWWAVAGVNKSHEGDIPDEEVIEEVLNAAMRSQLKYEKTLQERKENALKRANDGAKIMEEEHKNNPEGVDESDS